MPHPLQIAPRGDREIEMTRRFDAPPDLVFEAWTRPELLKRWLGVQNGWTLAVCEVDLRVGGLYRYVWRGPNGEEMGMRGAFQEIDPPGRLVTTERFDEPWYPGDAVNTLTLEAEGEQTICRLVTRYETTSARDGVLASPMEDGLAAGYAQLDDVLLGLESNG